MIIRQYLLNLAEAKEAPSEEVKELDNQATVA
jgi:hypothetical protein